MACAEAGECDVVVIESVSRMAREAADMLMTARKLSELGVVICTTGGGVLSGTATITITDQRGASEWRETITAVGVTAGSRVQLWLAPEDDSLENSPELLDLEQLSGTPGTGTIAVIATFFEPTSGPINLIWSAI